MKKKNGVITLKTVSQDIENLAGAVAAGFDNCVSKQELVVLKGEVAGLKQDMWQVTHGIGELKRDFGDLKHDVSHLEHHFVGFQKDFIGIKDQLREANWNGRIQELRARLQRLEGE